MTYPMSDLAIASLKRLTNHKLNLQALFEEQTRQQDVIAAAQVRLDQLNEEAENGNLTFERRMERVMEVNKIESDTQFAYGFISACRFLSRKGS